MSGWTLILKQGIAHRLGMCHDLLEGQKEFHNFPNLSPTATRTARSCFDRHAQWEVFSSCLFSLPFVFLVTTVLHRCAEKSLSDARIFFSLTAWQQLKLSVIVSKILYLYCSAFLLIASNLLACVVKAFRISPILFTQWLANLSTSTFNFPL